MSTDPAALRAAALSDLRTHACGTTWSMLDILLPDIPGAPYGGSTTPEQRRATAEATDSVVQPQARPAHLRALLRAWAASQPQPTRWEIRPYNTPNEHVWIILRDSEAVAEVYDRQDAEFVLAALQARPDPAATGLRTAIQTLSGLTEDGEPDLLARLQASITRARRSQ